MPPVNLMADTGIQFIDVGLDLSEDSPAMSVQVDFAELSRVDDGGRQRRVLIFPVMDELGGAYLDPATKGPISGNDVFTITARQALECFENFWVPLPYLRKKSETGFQDGPTAWCRMWFTTAARQAADRTHHLVLAFDTRCLERQDSGYLAPTDNDAANISQFGLASSPEKNAFFINKNWVREWLEHCFNARRARLGLVDGEMHFYHLGLYLTLLKVLETAGAFPTAALRTSAKLIDVDLIMDVGNSRSCGLLVEHPDEGRARFNHISRLTIRDLSRPDRTYSEPFEMLCEFAKAEFGLASAAKLCGLMDAFNWPSLVRVGHEAVRLGVIKDNQDDVTGMSSPKRYLWDRAKRDAPWRFNTAETGERVAGPALNQFSQRFTEDGRFIAPDNEKDIPGMMPCYSRTSIMTFALAEILLQANSFVNSVAHREHRGRPTFKRRLRRLVLTCPTAMLEAEKYYLRKHAQEAVEALKLELGDKVIDTDLEVLPAPEDSFSHNPHKRDWGFDEATCVQLTYLFGEIYERFENNSKLFFDLYGRGDGGGGQERSTVTVASLDIGGGTTDLMICRYRRQPAEAATVLTPEPIFWEGFNLAGDDILRRLVEVLVLPQIRATAEELGCPSMEAANVMNRLFSQDSAGVSAKELTRRRQFGRQVALPIALSMLEHVVEGAPPTIRGFESFYTHHPRPMDDIIRHVSQPFIDAGAEGFDLARVKWPLEADRINQVIRSVVQPMLKSLCGVVGQFNCDFLLVAGRPTVLPVIRDILLEYLPLTPDRIVPLGRYRIGDWYPFAEPNGMVSDPKTCVCVGGAVALMAGPLRMLDKFAVDVGKLKDAVGSTANYIGAYDESSRTLLEPLYFKDPQTRQATFRFDANMFLGMRQMDSPQWMASPMYRVRFRNQETARELAERLPLTVTIVRPTTNKERIAEKPARVMGADGKPVPPESVRIKPQTIVDEEGHWIDTGKFLVSRF